MITLAAGAALEVAKDVAHGIWKLLPPRAWAVVAIAVAAAYGVHRYAEHRHDQGVLEERGRWEAAQRAADARAKAAREARDKSAAAVDQAHADHAAAVQTETRKTTDQAVERASHAMHSLPPLPPGCPSGLPDRVRDEGRAAVERARAAGDSLRAGRDP